MIQFHWKVAYMGEVDYEVYGDGAVYRVSLRYAAEPYFRSIYNGDENQWQREVVASVGVLHTGCSEMVKPEVLAAFREYYAGKENYPQSFEVVAAYFDHTPSVRTWVRMPDGYVYNPTASTDSFHKHYPSTSLGILPA